MAEINGKYDVTVLADESLGGIKREYRGVKRRARVGERIKIIAEEILREHRCGEIYTVMAAKGTLPVDTDGRWDDGSVFNPHDEHYVVLEPTDIVRIGSSNRYRMVDRKANDGERIIVTAAEDNTDSITGVYDNGAIFTVEYSGKEIVDCVGGEMLYHREYHVLEPVESEEPDVVSQQIEHILERLAKVERILSTTADDVADDIQAMIVRVLSENTPRKSDMSRDEIVKRAKADVAELGRIGRDVDARLPRESSFYSDFYRIKFEINREKRTVVALVIGRHSGRVRSRGIAKCAPGDTFNVYIGKAIALRRALGLPIPPKYTNAPQPTEPKVGDVVHITGLDGTLDYIDVLLRRKPEKNGTGFGKLAFSTLSGRGWIADKQFRVIDDSRTGTEAEDYGI